MHLCIAKNIDYKYFVPERIRERAIALIGEAYSSVEISTLSKMTGLSSDDLQEIANEKKWTITGSVIKPHQISKPQNSLLHEEATEDQLFKLTQFVSFLEN